MSTPIVLPLFGRLFWAASGNQVLPVSSKGWKMSVCSEFLLTCRTNLFTLSKVSTVAVGISLRRSPTSARYCGDTWCARHDTVTPYPRHRGCH